MTALKKKVSLVGAFATGKTSLVRRFVHSMFRERYLSTVGVVVDRKAVVVAGRVVEIVLWDIEGPTGTRSPPPSYLRGSSGLLMVADGTRPETVQALPALRDHAAAVCGELPTAVAVNKVDLPGWALADGDRAAFEQHRWRVRPTSARTGEGVEELFAWLASAMLERSAP